MDEHVRRGLELFERGEYFEAHEVLEGVWTRERGPRKLFLQALIHLAVGFHHRRLGNPIGASLQFHKCVDKLEMFLPEFEGVDTRRLRDLARDELRAL